VDSSTPQPGLSRVKAWGAADGYDGGVEASAGDVGHVLRRAAHEAAFKRMRLVKHRAAVHVAVTIENLRKGECVLTVHRTHPRKDQPAGLWGREDIECDEQQRPT